MLRRLKVQRKLTNNIGSQVEKMNVIMVCESAQISGGAEKVAIQEAVELAKRGHRVGFIAANESAHSSLIESGVEVLLLNTTSFYEETRKRQKVQKALCNKEIEPKLRSFLSTFEPKETIIHCHTFRLKLSGIVPHIAQALGFSTVIHCHDYSPVCPTSLLFDHRLGSNCNRKPMSLSCLSCECQNQPWKYKLPKLTSYFWNQSVWKINQRAKGLVHISQLEQSTTEMASKSSTPGYNLPPISSYQSTNRVKAEGNQSFLFIGRITHEKGIEAFLEGATQSNVQAVVIGDGPLRSCLQDKYPSARFTGWLDEAAILTELQQARALVVPSLWRETLCLSVIDAMVLGVPCIVSQNVGAKEFIEDRVNGTIFADGQLSESIDHFSENEVVQRLSENAFLTFKDSAPSVERHVDALVSIYEQCLQRGPK